MVGRKMNNLYKIYINLPNLYQEAITFTNDVKLKEYGYNI